MAIESIGFHQTIRWDWLEATAQLAQESLDTSFLNRQLHNYLAPESKGAQTRRKRINVLTRIWARVSKGHDHLRDEALALWKAGSPEDHLWLHWGLALLAYPFFRDVAATVGRLSWLQEELAQAEVFRAIVARWGERATLEHGVRRILYSLNDWGVLVRLDQRRGRYKAANKRRAKTPEVALWILEAALRAHTAEALPLHDLLRLPELFPFVLSAGSDEIHGSPRFLVLQEGGNREMVMVKREAR